MFFPRRWGRRGSCRPSINDVNKVFNRSVWQATWFHGFELNDAQLYRLRKCARLYLTLSVQNFLFQSILRYPLTLPDKWNYRAVNNHFVTMEKSQAKCPLPPLCKTYLMMAQMKNFVFLQVNLCQKLFFLFVITNPQYDDRLFIELQVQYMKIPS